MRQNRRCASWRPSWLLLLCPAFLGPQVRLEPHLSNSSIRDVCSWGLKLNPGWEVFAIVISLVNAKVGVGYSARKVFGRGVQSKAFERCLDCRSFTEVSRSAGVQLVVAEIHGCCYILRPDLLLARASNTSACRWIAFCGNGASTCCRWADTAECQVLSQRCHPLPPAFLPTPWIRCDYVLQNHLTVVRRSTPTSY